VQLVDDGAQRRGSLRALAWPGVAAEAGQQPEHQDLMAYVQIMV